MVADKSYQHHRTGNARKMSSTKLTKTLCRQPIPVLTLPKFDFSSGNSRMLTAVCNTACALRVVHTSSTYPEITDFDIRCRTSKTYNYLRLLGIVVMVNCPPGHAGTLRSELYTINGTNKLSKFSNSVICSYLLWSRKSTIKLHIRTFSFPLRQKTPYPTPWPNWLLVMSWPPFLWIHPSKRLASLECFLRSGSNRKIKQCCRRCCLWSSNSIRICVYNCVTNVSRVDTKLKILQETVLWLISSNYCIWMIISLNN